jgi:hypothetical protein
LKPSLTFRTLFLFPNPRNKPMPFNEVENYARILKVKRSLSNPALIVELEKVLHDMAEDYEDRTDEDLLTLAQKHINKG